MRLRRAWLFITAFVLLAWLGWLFYLARTTARPIVLSRPQFLAADLVVIGHVAAGDNRPAAQVEVQEAYGPPPAPTLAGKRLQIPNLPNCTTKEGWKGPGNYLLPLVREGEEYRLARIPPSPGFPTPSSDDRPRIYLETPETRHQFQDVWRGRPGGAP